MCARWKKPAAQSVHLMLYIIKKTQNKTKKVAALTHSVAYLIKSQAS